MSRLGCQFLEFVCSGDFAVVFILLVLGFSCGWVPGRFWGVGVIHFCVFRWFSCGGGVGFGILGSWFERVWYCTGVCWGFSWGGVLVVS